MRHAASLPATAHADAAPEVDAAAALGPDASLDDLLAEAHQRYGNAAVAQLLASSGARALAGPGQPLPHRALLEARFGVDLGHVRAHVDPASQAGVRATGAEALARGADVAFATATPSVETAAHEVAHVLQQGGAGRGAAAGRATLEGEADVIAAQVAHGDGPVDLAGLSAGGDQLLGRGLGEQVQALLDEANQHPLVPWASDEATLVLRQTTRGGDPHASYADWRHAHAFDQRDNVDGAIAEIDDALTALDRANRRLARANQAKAALPAVCDEEGDGLTALQHRLVGAEVVKAQAEVEAAAGHAQALVARGVTIPPSANQARWRETSALRTREQLQLAEDRLTLLVERSHDGLLASGIDKASADVRLGKGLTLELQGGRTRSGYAADANGARLGGKDATPEVTDGGEIRASAGIVLDDATTGVRGELGGRARWGGAGSEVSLDPGVQGGYTVTVRRVGAGATPLFDVTIAFTLGGKLGVGGGHGAASVSGAVSAGAELVQRRRLTADELGGYAAALDRVEAGEAPGIAAFELDLLRGQLAHQGGEALAARAAALLRDPTSVATMAPHELVSLSTTLGAEGAVGAEGGGRSASASAELAVTRTVSIERLAGAPRDTGGVTQPVRLTIGFSENGKLHGEADGRYLGAEVELTRGDGAAVELELDADDPEYARVFAELTAATSREAVRAVAARPANAAYLRRSTRTRQEALSTGMSFGGGVALGVSRSADFAEERTLAYDAGAVVGAEGRYVGGSGYGAGLEVCGVAIADYRQRDFADAGYGADGPTLQVGEETTARRFAPWDNATTLRDAMASEHPLQALMLAGRTNTHGVDLAPADVARLIQRASDRRTWAAAVYPVDPQLAPAWEELRAAIADPPLDAQLRVADPELARQAGRAQAIATFMAGSRGKGYDIMRRVLDGGGKGEIGAAFEWPEGTGTAKLDFERVRAQLDIEGPRGPGAAAMRTVLERVQRRVDGTTFESPRAKVALLEEIQTMLTALGSQAPAPDQRIDVLVATLTAAKREEGRAIAAARAQVGAWFADDLEIYDHATDALEDLDRLWIPRIVELRELWVATHGDDRDCPVSTGPRQPRNAALEPDAEAREELYGARSRRGAIPDYGYAGHRQRRARSADSY